jgi:hypothetical protein
MKPVIRHIIPVAQPKGSQYCWAAVTAMVTGRSGPGIVMQIVAEAKLAKVPINANGSLDIVNGAASLAAAFKLSYESVDSMIAGEAVAKRMPMGPCGLMGVEKTGWHVVACHGMVGEDLTSASSSTILGVDPRGFTAINNDFFSFQNDFDIKYIVYR